MSRSKSKPAQTAEKPQDDQEGQEPATVLRGIQTPPSAAEVARLNGRIG